MNEYVHLARYDNGWFYPGRNLLWRALWLFAGQPIFGCSLLPSSRLRAALLRAFGAQIGKGVVIHSCVQVKYPWHLIVGDDCWLGERVWIDNLTTVRLGNDVCISQGAYLCTGNHDWTDPAFGLLLRPVSLENGAWAGAMSVLLPGTRLEEYSIVAAGSIASGTISRFEIHAGNPASFVRIREIGKSSHHAAEQVGGLS
ncbi:MAG: WcaF family extracellular polysaccharide biosynthesis acetyltransferase [Edaphobacter sp.]|uniref:WcaF family extracellular polysaccharide biosynthesis acetyltransferase n=1 Tax=Edaphobacter sp. TaxID=1934404 RepID=UPI00238ACC80|nr:WcaF family extracellular polysaccharide biosynthesis acetyltransferase [Edaphobacter sp.]MDE1175575.1 WcaF family extracellular polysaccharide biosynthesis acetyltransferase [Edaphobacter sp.]